VIATLAFARDNGPARSPCARAAIRSRAARSCDAGVVLDMPRMADVRGGPARRLARIGGGASGPTSTAQRRARAGDHRRAGVDDRRGRLDARRWLGLARRKHGLAADNLMAAELVTWDGRLVRAAADENPELLWGLRVAAAASAS
jgi:FAD/FMN-containing dehydrogenase